MLPRAEEGGNPDPDWGLFSPRSARSSVAGCRSRGLFLGILYIRGCVMIRTQEGTAILTAATVASKKLERAAARTHF